mgnify:CR=1 FL=1
MAIRVCSAILGALVLALTYVPVASFYLLKIEGSEREEGWFLRLRRYYVAHLEDAMNHPRRTLAVASAVVAVAVGSVFLLGTEFIPRLDEGAILEEGAPEQIFSSPREERTQRFLQRIIDAGRM